MANDKDKDKATEEKKVPPGGNPYAENGPYATGGFVGKGRRHVGDHRKK